MITTMPNFSTNPPIDFVVTWVDDQDPNWAAERDKYSPDPRRTLEASAESRFRDWGALRYWFRAVFRFCPWVRRVHLISTNPTPPWLEKNHPRISIIRHEEIIPAEHLPTFNSRVIELNMHRIKGLSDKFVYFNDDMYPLQPLSPDHFFPEGHPAGIAIQTALSVGDNISHAMLNNLRLINQTFVKRDVLKKNTRGWAAPKYGRYALQNLALMPWPRFTGFFNHHLPIPLLKSSCEAVWAEYPDALSATMESRFRQFHDVNVFLYYYWQLCQGEFTPVNPERYGRYEQLSPVNVGQRVAQIIRHGSVPLICINDGDVPEYAETARILESAMQDLLPDPSPVEI